MYLAMDMGTSNTRLWLCDKKQILDSKKATFGAKFGKTKGQKALFESLKGIISDLLSENNILKSQIECIISSGMSGSEIGLCEIPHGDLPKDVYSEATSLSVKHIPEITDIPFWFVPGLKSTKNGLLEDIIRGEETEIFGILPYLPKKQQSVVVLPGTHNKIVLLDENGAIVDFKTTFSGEMLDMIITNSILSGAVSHSFEISEVYVMRGADYAKREGINSALFHLRVMSKNGVSQDDLSSFLYGAVLGEDANLIRNHANGRRIFIGGNKTLQSVYQILLQDTSACSLQRDIADQAVVCGLMSLYSIHKAYSKRDSIISAIANEKIISILRNPVRETLIESAQALYDGGIRLLEITFSRTGAPSSSEICEMISTLSDKFDGKLLVGAGTVTSPDEVFLAFEAGASYIISPNCNPEIIELTRNLGMVSIPAAYTPTEIAAALDHGADYIKLFPADSITREYLYAVCAPLSDAKLLAVGGVNADNVKDFIGMGFCGVGVGSNLYNKRLIKENDFKALKNLAKKYIDSINK